MRVLWRVAAPVAFAAAGVLFATSAGIAQGGQLRGSSSDLGDLIRAQQQRADALGRTVDRLRGEMHVATDKAGKDDQRIRASQERSHQLDLVAGTIAVTGPGVSVTLSDAPRTPARDLPAGTRPDDLVVHQQDVQAVVNAMWAGGAEAMQVMDQRIISTSAVRCVGNTLILQGRVYSPPYTITAIGAPESLLAALDAAPAVDVYRYYAETYGLVYERRARTSVRLPAFDGTLELLHARAGS